MATQEVHNFLEKLHGQNPLGAAAGLKHGDVSGGAALGGIAGALAGTGIGGYAGRTLHEMNKFDESKIKRDGNGRFSHTAAVVAEAAGGAVVGARAAQALYNNVGIVRQAANVGHDAIVGGVSGIGKAVSRLSLGTPIETIPGKIKNAAIGGATKEASWQGVKGIFGFADRTRGAKTAMAMGALAGIGLGVLAGSKINGEDHPMVKEGKEHLAALMSGMLKFDADGELHKLDDQELAKYDEQKHHRDSHGRWSTEGAVGEAAIGVGAMAGAYHAGKAVGANYVKKAKGMARGSAYMGSLLSAADKAIDATKEGVKDSGEKVVNLASFRDKNQTKSSLEAGIVKDTKSRYKTALKEIVANSKNYRYGVTGALALGGAALAAHGIHRLATQD